MHSAKPITQNYNTGSQARFAVPLSCSLWIRNSYFNRDRSGLQEISKEIVSKDIWKACRFPQLLSCSEMNTVVDGLPFLYHYYNKIPGKKYKKKLDGYPIIQMSSKQYNEIVSHWWFYANQWQYKRLINYIHNSSCCGNNLMALYKRTHVKGHAIDKKKTI